MPELYPGMRVKLEGHSLQVYVTEVIHSGDWENGFTTRSHHHAPSDPTLGRAVNNIATTAADFSSAIDIISGTSSAVVADGHRRIHRRSTSGRHPTRRHRRG